MPRRLLPGPRTLVRHLAALHAGLRRQARRALAGELLQRHFVDGQRRRLLRRLDEAQAHAAMAVAERIDPVAADAGIAGRDHDAHAAVRLVAAAILGHVALAVLVIVEVLLPQVA